MNTLIVASHTHPLNTHTHFQRRSPNLRPVAGASSNTAPINATTAAVMVASNSAAFACAVVAWRAAAESPDIPMLNIAIK
jgi:hypothetical protein